MMIEKGIRRKKLKSMMVAFLFVSLIGLASLLLINYHVVSSVKDRIVSEDEAALLDADCILILGAGVWNNERPSHMLEDRLLQGIKLYRNGASDRLLMSGDHGRKEYDEVNIMKQFAIDRDIHSEHIFMDHAGFNTYDSLYRAKDIFQAEKIIVVTQKYHLYRALYIAKKLEIEAYGVASDPRSYAGQEVRDFRETLARVKDFINVMIKPEPTFLGETIPVTGNGNLTND
ncbi:SanA/YdcF family protein [Desulfotomaculum sp. 1211_IL3151]|uniref:SanA/YdcF family protein n=1 Tax=Desulfotomaculum sp. 1211_IL3151 TaxID=3084055 RepID=UPI002FDB1911